MICPGFSDHVGGVIINAYSYAIRKALAILTTPVVEIHMSKLHAREEFAITLNINRLEIFPC